MLKIKDNLDIKQLECFGFSLRKEDNYYVKKVYLKNGEDDKNFYQIHPVYRTIELTRLDGELDATLYDLIKADLVIKED